MDFGETARILAKMVAYDKRTVGDADVHAWAEIVGDLDFGDALAAVTRHYRDSDDFLMPATLRRLAKIIRDERQRTAAKQQAIEARHEPGLPPLKDRRPEIRDFVNKVRDVLPAGDPDALRHGTRYWRHEQAIHRDRAEEPNPDFDPTMVATVEWQADTRPVQTCWWEDESARERHAIGELAKAGRLRLKMELPE